MRDYLRRLRAEEEAVKPSSPPPEPKWVPGYRREPRPCDPPPVELVERPSLEDTRAMMAKAICEYLAIPSPGHVLLVRAAPGVGKTTAGVLASEAHAGKGHQVLYAGPRHAFFKDVIAIAQKPELWYEWLPRQRGDDETGKSETCRHEPQITTWMRKGWKGIEFCKGVCKWDYVKNKCPYYAQLKTQEPIIFGMHEHVVHGHPAEFHAVVGDESPIGKFAHRWAIPSRWVMPGGMDSRNAFTHLVVELRDLTETGMHVWSEQLLTILGGARRVADSCDAFSMSVGDTFLQPAIGRPGRADEVDYAHLPQLCSLLAREARMALEGRDYVSRVEVWDKKLTLYLRHGMNSRIPPHVVWLDATGESELYKACFRRPVRVVEARPKLRGRVFQVWGRQYGKDSVMGRDEGNPNIKRITQAEDTVWRIIAEHRYKNPGIITFKGLTEVGKLVKELEHGHFYAARGTNQFEGCDALFVVGTPQPPVLSLVSMAKMLFFERDEAFRPDWVTQSRRLSYLAPDGMGREHDVSGFWNDRALGSLLWSFREAEVIQAAHRARPVHRDADVWLITNLPTPELPLSGLFSIREVFDAPEGVNVFRWREVVEFAERCVADHEWVTTVDFVEGFGCSKSTAIKYVKKLMEHFGWEAGSARPRGNRGGMPPLSATPR